jgi:hypothetical protein
MLMDADLLFSDAQAITAQAASTNAIDLGALFAGNSGRPLGLGEPLYLAVTVDVAMTDASSDSTLTVELQTDDNSGFSTPTTVALGTIPALTAAGARFFFNLPEDMPYERFIRLRYTPNNGNLTTGSFTAGLVKYPAAERHYAAARGTGI